MSHAHLAPSKSERVLLCAASAGREAQFPDDEGGPAANEGSNVHWIGELALKDQCWPPNLFKQGMPMVQASAPYPDIDITQENIDNAKAYFDYVQRRVAETGGTLLVEEKVDPQLYTGRADSDGSCDAGIVSNTLLEAVDYKNGGIEVDPDASQLKLYGLGLMAKYADPTSGLAPFETVRLTVFQPKRPGMDAIERSQDFTQAELIDWAVETWVPAANASDDPNARATVTEKGCRYCKAQKHAGCPEYTAAQQGAAAQLFKPVDGQAVTVVDPLQSTFVVETMTPDDIGYFLDVWPLMKARAKDIEEHAVELLKQRTVIPGHKLVRGRGSRAWSLPDEEMAVKLKNMKIKLDLAQPRKVCSPAQMLSQEITTGQKNSVKKLIVNKEGALTIAPTSDKRVDAAPAVEFKPVEAEAAAPAVEIDFLAL